jgi:hypothetical protein
MPPVAPKTVTLIRRLLGLSRHAAQLGSARRAFRTPSIWPRAHRPGLATGPGCGSLSIVLAHTQVSANRVNQAGAFLPDRPAGTFFPFRKWHGGAQYRDIGELGPAKHAKAPRGDNNRQQQNVGRHDAAVVHEPDSHQDRADDGHAESERRDAPTSIAAHRVQRATGKTNVEGRTRNRPVAAVCRVNAAQTMPNGTSGENRRAASAACATVSDSTIIMARTWAPLLNRYGRGDPGGSGTSLVAHGWPATVAAVGRITVRGAATRPAARC